MPRLIARAGSSFKVVYAATKNGSPGYDFVNSLSEPDQAKLLHLFKMFGDHGRISNPEHFKKIEGTEFFEFKSFQIRMPCYYAPGRLLVVTHGFLKKRGRTPSPEIARAGRIKKEDSILFPGQGASKKWPN